MICIELDVQCYIICSDIMQGTILDVDLASGTLEHSCGCVRGNSGAALTVAKGEVVAMHTDGDNRLKNLTGKASFSDATEKTFRWVMVCYLSDFFFLMSCQVCQQEQGPPLALTVE